MPNGRGIGEARAHHGEILQGIFEDERCHRHRGLVSLPCRHLRSEAVFFPNAREHVTVSPSSCEKARRAAELAMLQAGCESCGGHLVIASDIPAGRGLGSSTADVLAAIHAVIDYLDVRWTNEEIMRVAVGAETACDATLFTQNAVLFAQREGEVIEPFHRPVPPIDIISVDTEPLKTVSTLDFVPAQYNTFEAEAFKSLRSLLRRAIRLGDLDLLGRVATASANLNERFLPKPGLRALQEIAGQCGAFGIQVAHSGTVVGLMFDPRAPETPQKIDRASSALSAADFQFRIFNA
jgi:uncharacterized protein involved in propanediol utilization